VILRRGPSKWVEVIAWDTHRDTFDHGAWFHGRIYQRRSDLSPDGTKLVYFASKFTSKTVNDPEYTYAWTAVSKVPYLTALALWPKSDCWWGGGLFQDNYTVFLNHRPSEATPQYRERFSIEAPVARHPIGLEGVEWVDWDQAGRLAFLRRGAVWVSTVQRSEIGEPNPLIDLTADQPTRQTPRWAEAW